MSTRHRLLFSWLWCNANCFGFCFSLLFFCHMLCLVRNMNIL
uniref:Uncharacterized protein n=1 Tax=Rhizophora mucronata TaxID=61149 RepID=A0A2P2R0U2_RHIMU